MRGDFGCSLIGCRDLSGGFDMTGDVCNDYDMTDYVDDELALW